MIRDLDTVTRELDYGSWKTAVVIEQAEFTRRLSWPDTSGFIRAAEIIVNHHRFDENCIHSFAILSGCHNYTDLCNIIQDQYFYEQTMLMGYSFTVRFNRSMMADHIGLLYTGIDEENNKRTLPYDLNSDGTILGNTKAAVFCMKIILDHMVENEVAA